MAIALISAANCKGVWEISSPKLASMLTPPLGGGVLDKSVMESEVSAFPQETGFAVHGINGMMIVPALAVLLLVEAFFAKVPRGVALAGGVVGLVALQVVLGMLGHGIPSLGLLHGANALALFVVAVMAARGAGVGQTADALPTGRHGAASAI